MNRFTRSFYSRYKDGTMMLAIHEIKRLKETNAFDNLIEGVATGEVYPALRNNEIHFYHSGARLCTYKGKSFYWHENSPCNDKDDYKEILTLCKKWGEKNDGSLKERAVLSRLCKKYSPYVSDGEAKKEKLVLLDIEVGFPCLYLQGKNIRDSVQVDLLFLDLDTGILHFVEAKESNDARLKILTNAGEKNDDIYKHLEDESKIGYQLIKYRENLRRRNEQIEVAYYIYCNIMREIFGGKLLGSIRSVSELSCNPEPKLLVYGAAPTCHGERCIDAISSKLGKNLIQCYDINKVCRIDKLSKSDIVR